MQTMRLGTRSYAYPSPELGEMVDSTAALAAGDVSSHTHPPVACDF